MWGVYRRAGRAAAILLAVLVVATSCGGGEEPASDGDGEQEQEFGQLQESGDAQQADASSDLEQPDTDQAEPSEAESALEPVQLGLRFPWCAEVQSRWNGMVETLAAAAVAEAAYGDAREAHEAATDELDAAEARVALERAESVLEERRSGLERVSGWAVPLIIPGTPPLDDNTTVNIETHAIAVKRAREAFRDSADPVTLELSELIHRVDWSAADLTADQGQVWGTSLQSPQPFDLARDVPDDPQDRLDATVALIGDLQTAALEAVPVAVAALEEMGHVITLAAAVSNSEDALVAYQTAMEAMRSLGQVSTASRKDLESIVAREHIATDNLVAQREFTPAERDAYRKTLGEAARAVEFPDIGPQLPAWVTEESQLPAWVEEFGEAPDPDDAVGYYAWSASQRGERLLSELARVGEGFILADTAGVDAFLASISESCEA